MLNLAESIKIARKKAGLTQLEFSNLLEIGRSSLAQYESGIYKPNIEVLTLMAKKLNIDISELIGDKSLKREVKFVPVIGTTSCGGTEMNYLQDENRKAYYNGDFWKQSLYCVIANGDSMAPEIDDGDEVIIDPDVPCQHGDMVYYKIDDESAIKVLAIDKEAHIMQFVPYNSSELFKIKTIRLDDEETISKLTYHKVVSVNKLKFNNRLARLKMIGR